MSSRAPEEPQRAPGAVSTARTAAWTGTALIAFAANSLLARFALAGGGIDAASFSSVRVASGALLLGLAAMLRGAEPRDMRPRWSAALALACYLIFFSFAYLSLGAGMGALILFGAVQLTMFAAALAGGERLGVLGWCGVLLAALGFVYLLSPGLAAPRPAGAVMMAIAGVGWGVYSLAGRGAGDPVIATARNFLAALPLVLLANAVFVAAAHLSASGVLLAAASGAIASGCGYVVWYAALKGLSASSAATLQLSVPVIAAFGGVVLLAEPPTLRLVVASVVILGGIALALNAGARRRG